ncbi:MFS transporter [Arthrobacter sp. Marseille-P9274]|uniref:MFS transporter n=1 Tax=Arthrobacter sp. Marseille-P9274 TaxID=2866572 RepID=UPI0021C853F2|nr:MFS transporter [Arthrobacter sp. Marseille-P9274]
MTVELAPAPLLSKTYRATTAGIFALAFLFAFEAIAVATVMPVVGRELDGLPLYAIAFSAPLAVGVVATAMAGRWIDARGPGPALRIGVGLFVAGLIAAALAPTMPVFLVGRGIQGFGSGLAGVGLYVLIARAYPEGMRARAFTVLTSGWVLPALAGPAIAGLINDLVGWRWVFGGAPLFAVVAYFALAPALRSTRQEGAWKNDGGRTAWAAMVAAGILGVAFAGQQSLDWWVMLAAASVAAVLLAAPRLLPKGTWLFRRGLPAVISARGLVGAGFFGAEVYLPLALVEHRGFTPTEAGLLLTTSAVAWFSGSWLAANLPFLAGKVMRVRLGAGLLAAGVGLSVLSLNAQVPVAVVVVGWALAGLGIGMAFSTLSVLLLDHSADGEEGTNSSALQINDAVAQSLWLALGSIAFAALLPVAPLWGFITAFGGSFAIALLALLLTRRLAGAPEGG